ncbi:MAG: fluoride efflux transporter CrcB [Gordonia sp. (in: high G+C Gram-positive bacteria)]
MIAVGVIIAGACGAVARFVVDGAVKRRWPTTFPLATFGINVTGSLLLGLIAGSVLYQGVDPGWQAVLGTGFCGGYTTFSTAAFETVRLAQARKRILAGAYAVGSLAATVAACVCGLVIGWAI